jgi:lysozyme
VNYSEDCFNLTKASEGCELNAYQDPVGIWTIGYGHTPAEKGQQWTIAQAEAQLASDLQRAQEEMQALVKVPLTQGQTDALTDFVFNLGSGNLQTSTLLRKLNAGLYSEVPAELAKWVYGGGKILPGLQVRREKEIALWNKPS